MIEGSAEEPLERTLGQADWSLEESERRYREIFENAKDAIYVHDLNGRYTLVNRAAEKLTGYSREEILQLTVFDMASPEHVDLICNSLKQKLSDHAPTTYEVEAIRKDGTPVPVEVSSRLIYRNGRPIGVQGTVRDIKERRRAEEVVRASEQRYRDLVENANDIIFTCDMLGNITSLNRAGERVTGYTAEEALKMNIAQAVSPDDIAKVRHMLSRKRVADVATVYDLELITKSGGRAAVEVSSRAIVKDGEAVGVQGIARDITDRQRMEDDLRASQAQLQQSQKLEAVGQLAGGVAHDFNNLLTAIIGYSDFALRKMRANNPIRLDIEEIKKAAGRAASLTRQLLAFSRKQILKPEILDLNLVVGDMHKMLQRLIGEDIDLITTLTTESEPVRADRGQLEQIIMNLVVNARDAMPFGGSVTIETANAMFDDASASEHLPVKAGKYVMLAVSDTGLGMDANTKLHIFEPFFTTKELGKGTGLGLSTVYGIVKQSGGFICVYSELNVGTTFKIYLPSLGELGFEQDARSFEASDDSETGTVLLVEDDPLVRNVALRALESAGYQVLESRNGHGALAMAQSCEDEIDLLITDVVMPLMGGRELAQELSALHPKTSILFMSGYTDDAVVRHGVMDKDIEYLQKPFTPESLVRRVGEVLRDARTRASRSD
ncbi:MAG TPA: PAS domain S-box protein [Pyrinomonadaceae bacterium]|nr:PAS domain S-box protein [Pyrinomonadaceae bacterium]